MASTSKGISLNEIMICTAANQVSDGDTVVMGVGLPLISGLLAKKTHAPNAVLMVELGIVDLTQEVIRGPGFFGLTITPNTSMICSLTDVLGTMLQGGWITMGFLGAAQIDRFGNINTTSIGHYDAPKVKMPGSGGANDLASLAERTCIVMKHGKERLVEEVDFITSPGHLGGPGDRIRQGLPGGGPFGVITNMGVFRFSSKSEMYVETYHPGCTVEEIIDNTGWPIEVATNVSETRIDKSQLKALRKMDPQGIYR
jgi:glutaconate CoA-transferase subunit B